VKMMKCVHLAGFRQMLKLKERPMPQPYGTQVLLRVLGAGMCHSDVHIWEGTYDLGGGRQLSMRERVRMPLVMGHESTGQVVALGENATGIAKGSRHLICGWIGCGQCSFCDEGNEHLCSAPQFLGLHRDGGYADHILVPHPRYLIDLGDLDPVAAAPLACSGLTTYSALKKAGSRLHERAIVIIGAGGLGLMALDLLKMMGGRGAVVVEIDPKKREAALAAGALATVDPLASNAAQRIREAAGGPIQFVLDLVGSGDTVGLGFELLDRVGKLVVVGLFGGAVQLSTALIPLRAVTVQGSYNGSSTELRELVALVRHSAPLTVPIIRRPLAEAGQALNELRNGKVVGRVVLVP